MMIRQEWRCILLGTRCIMGTFVGSSAKIGVVMRIIVQDCEDKRRMSYTFFAGRFRASACSVTAYTSMNPSGS